MVDWFQAAAIVVESGAAICLGVYYGMFGQPTGQYVSDLLFSMVAYQVIVTVFVSIQIVLCVLLVWRLSGGFTWKFGLAAVPLLTSVVGWIVLNLEYRAPDGSTSAMHIWGTAVFVVGVALYFIFLMVCTRGYLYDKIPLHFIMELILILLFVATMVFIIVFAWKFACDESGGWIYEHAAFITMAITHALLFTIASPNPWTPKRSDAYKLIDDGSAKGGANGGADSTPSQRQFLIPRHMR